MEILTEEQLLEINVKAQAIYHAHNDCMTVKECALYLKKSSRTICSYLQKGIIKGELLDGKWSIPKLQFLDKIISDWSKK